MTSNMYRDKSVPPAVARHWQVTWEKKVKHLARQTNFSEDQLQALCLIFHKICEVYEWWGSAMGKQDHVDRLVRVGFRDVMSSVFGLHDAPGVDGLFRALDPDQKRYVTVARWARGLSAIRGSDLDRALLCWPAYTEESTITRSSMAAHTRRMFVDCGMDDFEGFCKEFVDTMLKGTKAAKEGFMPENEYLDIAVKRPLFTEFLLNVLPSRESLNAFLATFTPPPRPRHLGRRYRRAGG